MAIKVFGSAFPMTPREASIGFANMDIDPGAAQLDITVGMRLCDKQ